MRTIRSTILLAFVSALLWTGQAFAVVDQALQVQGTNLVLSWPSLGYEYYMIEYRPTLDPATPWIQLTNCLHANSTNRTTYVIPCCVLNDLGGGSSAASFSGAGDSLVASDSGASDTSSDTELWAVPANGPGDPSPRALYPPWFDTNGLVIYDAPSQSSRLRSTSSSGAESDGPTGPGMDGLTSGGCNCPDLGFFRVWHIPDWLGNVTNYVFDGPTFIPVDFKDYRDRVANIEVLLDGQPTADAIYTSLDYQGVTYWGMGVYFDLYPSGTHTLQLRTTLQLDDTVGDASVFLVLSNLTRPITVDNQVTFTNWDDLIQSTNFTFHAQTKTNNTDWWIDIYDAYNNFVNGGSGHTTNGQISW